MEKDITYYDCMAECHVLRISHDKKFHTVEMGIFGPEHDPSLLDTLKERVRWAWHILKGNSPWTDFIILDYNDLHKLKQNIDTITEEARANQIEKGFE